MANRISRFLKALSNPTPATSAAYFDATVTPQDIARKYNTPTKNIELMKLSLACSTVITYASMNANSKASFIPRMYKKTSAKSPFRGVKARPLSDKLQEKHLRNASPFNGVGKSAYYAERAGAFEEVVEHPFLSLYRQPNPMQTGSLYWNLSFLFREITGNSYSEIVRDSQGYPVAFWPLYSQFVSPMPSKDNLLDGWRYEIPGNKPIYLEPSDVFQLKYNLSRFNVYEGAGWVEQIVQEANILMAANAVNEALFANGCRPDYALLMPDANPTQAKEMIESLRAQHYGPRKSGGIVGLFGATDLKPIQRTNKEMEHASTMERYERAIRQAAGVTESQANLNDSNLASAYMADIQYQRQTIQPALINHAEQLTDFLIREYRLEEGEYWIAYDNVVPVEREAIIKQTTTLFMSDVIALDEARAEVGFQPIGDERGSKLSSELKASASPIAPALPFLQENASGYPTPIEQNSALKGSEASPRTPTSPSASPQSPATAQAPGLPQEGQAIQGDQSQTRPRKRLSAYLKANKGKCGCGSLSLKSEGDSAPIPRDKEEAFIKALEDYLRASATAGSYDKDALRQICKQRITEIFSAGYDNGIRTLQGSEEGRALLSSLSPSLGVVPQKALDFVSNYTFRLAENLTETQHQSLRDAISTAIENGETPQEATRRVQQSFQDKSRFEAERIARTETIRAYSQGNLTVWKDSGVTKKEWLLASGACAICQALKEQADSVVGINDSFIKKGQSLSIDGTDVEFDYEDIHAPPAHPLCRCAIVPVFD